MRIGIDARLINETGVGRYIRNLIDQLVAIDTEHEYVIFLREKEFLSYKRPNARWSARLADVRWHTILEQFVMPKLLVSERLDLLHVPYFNIPIFYPGRMIVTIHDLIILHVNTGKASTLPPLLYTLKRFAYMMLLTVGLIRVDKIIAVSEATKSDIMQSFHIPEHKIAVTYEGVTKQTKKTDEKNKAYLRKFQETIAPIRPYLLYVGNAYPHKNIGVLIRYVKEMKHRQTKKNSKNHEPTLLLVGPDDYFYTRYKTYVQNNNLSTNIRFYGPATYEELSLLYKNALALVFPSVIEGFGLPGIEAMHSGIPVLASDIPVFHEIYGDAAVYFDPYSEQSLLQTVETILKNTKLRNAVIQKGYTTSKKYSWETMARKTLDIYR